MLHICNQMQHMCKFADGRINSATGLRAGEYTKVRVYSFECDFSDMRIDKKTVLEERCHYCMKV